MLCYHCSNTATHVYTAYISGSNSNYNVCRKCFVFLCRGTHPSQTGSKMPPPRTTRWPSNKPKVARLIYEPAIQGYSLNFTYDPGLVDFLKKAIPSHKRTYDPTTHIWNFSSEFFDVVRLLFDAHRDYTLTIVSEAEVLKKIQEQEEASRHTWTPQAHSIDQDLQKFTSLLYPVLKDEGFSGKKNPDFAVGGIPCDFSMSLLKEWNKDMATKYYRRAAMFYHPDRNGGDATKMSELNAVWQVLKESYYIK